jgi:thiol-disulfide isomerase/thioredoxin
MVVVVNSPEEFQSAFDGLSGTVLALFTGSKDPVTGESWCPDCVSADPFIHQAIANHQETVILICEVGPRESWRNNPSHPYRTMASTKVKCVPTLIRYQNKKEIARLEEGQILNQDILDELFS